MEWRRNKNPFILVTTCKNAFYNALTKLKDSELVPREVRVLIEQAKVNNNVNIKEDDAIHKFTYHFFCKDTKQSRSNIITNYNDYAVHNGNNINSMNANSNLIVNNEEVHQTTITKRKHDTMEETSTHHQFLQAHHHSFPAQQQYHQIHSKCPCYILSCIIW